MKKEQRYFYGLLISSALAIVCLVTFFYIRLLSHTISDNTIRTISEIAKHDRSTIQTYIDIRWEDLSEIMERFVSDDCRTAQDIETRMDLECASSGYTHLYLLAKDGTVYTDQYITYPPDRLPADLDLLSYFANDSEKIVARSYTDADGGRLPADSILYGIRLEDQKIAGQEMTALIGISDLSSIQDKMVIDSFIKDGKCRGHSALVDRSGNYIVNINKEIYLNAQNNLFTHLSEAEDSELTNGEVRRRLADSETFGFYHSHAEERYKELFYFMPFEDDCNLYFIMSVNDEVFVEQSRTFVTMSIIMLVLSMLTVVTMLLALMRYQARSIRSDEKARSQKEFLSNMSHEIRTPLNGLIGMNHLIMVHIDEEKQRPQIKEWLKKSHSTANYLLSLVNDILDMSKLQAGKVDLLHEPLLIDDLISEITAMQTDNIESRGVQFIVEKEIQIPCVEGDATRTKQILMNIVGNAAKFTPKGGHIRLSVHQEQIDSEHVQTIYRCEDTGIGISQEYIGRIFDSFSQERNRNTDGIKGTGLGMAISKLLTDAMGGDITVESELDVGSTFTVRIPSVIVKDIPDHLREGHKGEHDASADRPGAECPAKILIAEDVDLNAEILLEILDLEGFETAHAKDGQEAVDLFEKSQIGEFDIILMDMQMPVMDGCTAARKIRELDRSDARSVVIYACTANTFQEDRAMAIESGMDDFLTKPIDVGTLLRKMERSAQKR